MDHQDETTTDGSPAFDRGPERLYLVGLAGPDAGLEFHLNRPTMILGRGPGASLIVTDSSVSRRHVKVLLVPDSAAPASRRAQVIDLQSTNGVFVNGDRVARALLQPGDKVLVGKTVFRLEHRDNFDIAFYDRLHQMATTDPLTGAGNRWALQQELERQEGERLRYNRSFSVLIIDVDNLKEINRVCGHGGGDQALRAVGAVILQSLRDSDRVFRYGGDEFVVLLAQSDLAGADTVAERIRAGVESLLFEHLGQVVLLRVSIGGAEAAGPALLERADKALFEAKSSGRNQVRFNTEPTPRTTTARLDGDKPPESRTSTPEQETVR